MTYSSEEFFLTSAKPLQVRAPLAGGRVLSELEPTLLAFVEQTGTKTSLCQFTGREHE